MNNKDLLEELLAFNNEQKLTDRISEVESQISNINNIGLKQFIKSNNYNEDFLYGALKIKEIAGEINVLIHYYGIIMSLPNILNKDESIEELSLGAGNTGKDFDCTTNKRIAEFKFIHWKGHDTIRQNSTFKDFYYLAEEDTDKRKCLYLLDTSKALKFFNGKRSLNSVLSKDTRLRDKFFNKYSNDYKTVSDYYTANKDKVEIIDLRKVSPEIWT